MHEIEYFKWTTINNWNKTRVEISTTCLINLPSVLLVYVHNNMIKLFCANKQQSKMKTGGNPRNMMLSLSSVYMLRVVVFLWFWFMSESTLETQLSLYTAGMIRFFKRPSTSHFFAMDIDNHSAYACFRGKREPKSESVSWDTSRASKSSASTLYLKYRSLSFQMFLNNFSAIQLFDWPRLQCDSWQFSYPHRVLHKNLSTGKC